MNNATRGLPARSVVGREAGGCGSVALGVWRELGLSVDCFPPPLIPQKCLLYARIRWNSSVLAPKSQVPELLKVLTCSERELLPPYVVSEIRFTEVGLQDDRQPPLEMKESTLSYEALTFFYFPTN